MTRPLTDREQVQVLSARVAELEEELAAYRANEDQEARWARQAGRLHRVGRRLRSLAGGRLENAMGLARILLDMLDHPGMCRTKAQLVLAWRPADAELPDSLKVADVLICRLRKVVGFAAIDTVWGHGWLVPFEQVAGLRYRIGEGGP
jgi:hypothetical protein